jgi:hypothetical protein
MRCHGKRAEKTAMTRREKARMVERALSGSRQCWWCGRWRSGDAIYFDEGSPHSDGGWYCVDVEDCADSRIERSSPTPRGLLVAIAAFSAVAAALVVLLT